MKRILFLPLVILMFSCGSSEPNPCLMSEDFIKKELKFPNEAKFSILDCSSEKNADGSYTILRKVEAKNAFGMQSSYIYKVTMNYNGGIPTDIKNWSLVDMRSEEFN